MAPLDDEKLFQEFLSTIQDDDKKVRLKKVHADYLRRNKEYTPAAFDLFANDPELTRTQKNLLIRYILASREHYFIVFLIRQGLKLSSAMSVQDVFGMTLTEDLQYIDDSMIKDLQARGMCDEQVTILKNLIEVSNVE